MNLLHNSQKLAIAYRKMSTSYMHHNPTVEGVV